MADEPRLDRPVTLAFRGDWGQANMHRICGWLAQEIGPVGVVIRSVVRRVLPEAGHWSAHRVAMEVLSDLVKAGLLDERGNA